ncbi:MAG: transposase, partial [Planctomycetota bacterium]
MSCSRNGFPPPSGGEFFGSALNHHVHLHACVTDGVFVPAADDAERDAPPAFLPARPITS